MLAICTGCGKPADQERAERQLLAEVRQTNKMSGGSRPVEADCQKVRSAEVRPQGVSSFDWDCGVRFLDGHVARCKVTPRNDTLSCESRGLRDDGF